MRRIFLAMAVSLLLNGCITQPPAPVDERQDPDHLETSRQARMAMPAVSLPHSGRGATARPTQAMPIKAINIRNQCRFEDEVGTKGQMALHIEEANVKQFSAEVKLAKYGTCRFDLKGFRQTEKLPAAVLLAKKGNCSVRMWQQDSQLTVAFTDCQSYCSGDAFSYLWPILTDTQTGECS